MKKRTSILGRHPADALLDDLIVAGIETIEQRNAELVRKNQALGKVFMRMVALDQLRVDATIEAMEGDESDLTHLLQIEQRINRLIKYAAKLSGIDLALPQSGD